MPLAMLGALGAFLIEIIQIVMITQEPELEKIRQAALDWNPSHIITPAEAAEANARSIRDTDALAGLARRGGINRDQFDVMTDLRRGYPTPAEIMEASFRSFLAPNDVDRLLARTGLAPEAAELTKKLAVYLPNVQDVLRFFIRDAFIPEFVERFGMDLEIPPDAREWFAKLGISEDVEKLFWRAHWELPSISQAFDMFQRDAKTSDGSPVTKEDLLRLLRAQGVEPFWRPAMVDISYNPLTRVDIRRMAALKVIDRDAVVTAYRHTGYSPANAELLTRFTYAQLDRERTEAAKKLSAATVKHVINADANGKIGQAEAEQLLEKLGVPPEEIVALRTSEALEREALHVEHVQKLVSEFYIGELWSADQAAAELVSNGFTSSEAVELVASWELDRKYHQLKAHHKDTRDLLKAEILEAFTDHLMPKDEAKRRLLILRYPPADADLELAVAEYKRAKADLKDEQEATHQQFKAGKITETEAATQLDKLELRPQHRDALITRWMAETRSKTALLTVAQLTTLYKAKNWTLERIVKYLPKLGYTPEEVTAIAAIIEGKEGALP